MSKILEICEELYGEIERLEEQLQEAHFMNKALEVVLDQWGDYQHFSFRQRKVCIELEILHKSKTELSYSEIAEKYGVSRETVLRRRRIMSL
jgi:DNA-directed RNA polymerase sigma subunit (sigma70/sigma32)